MQGFQTPDIAAFAEDAGHYGVSPEDYVASFPGVGVTVIEEVRNGRAIMLPAITSPKRVLLTSKELCSDVSRKSRTVLPDLSGLWKAFEPKKEPSPVTFYVHDSVAEYCSKRNLAPLTVAHVGYRLLSHAANEGVGVDTPMAVRQGATRRTPGKLVSELTLKLSPINTLIMEKKEPNALKRLAEYGRLIVENL